MIEIRTCLDAAVQDVRFALRSFRRRPGFAAVIVLTMGLALGASTTVFSLVEAVLLRDLPYHDPGSLVMLWTAEPRSHRSHKSSYPDFDDWRSQSRAFTGLAAFDGGSLTLTGTAAPERVETLETTPSLFDVLGVRPSLGRLPAPADGPRVALLAHGLWTRRFGADRAIVGREVRLDGNAYTVVGVLPAGFHFPPYRFDGEPDIFVPLQPRVDRDIFLLEVVGRLKPGTTRADAQRDMDALATRIDRDRPAPQKGRGVNVAPIRDHAVMGARHTTLTLFLAVAFVLLIACANVANLLLAHGSARQAELATRAALGAGRWRLVRQLLTESLLLAAGGGALGLLVARWCLPLVVSAAPPRTQFYTRLHDAGVQINGTVLGFAAAAALLTGLVFGVAPALRSVRTTPAAGGPRVTARLRGSLVMAELALSFVLLAAAGLMLRTVARLVSESLGFRTERLLTATLSLPERTYPDSVHRVRAYELTLRSAGQLPGVRSAAVVVNLPMTRSAVHNGIEVEGASVSGGTASFDSVSPGYFATMEIPLVRGRSFAEADSDAAPPVVVVNQALVRKFWPDTDPIGKAIVADRAVQDETPAGRRLRFVRDRCEVVGVVGDAKQLGLDDPPQPAVYFPFAQRPSADMTLVLRTAAAPMLVAPALAHEMRRLDANLPLVDVRTMDEWVDREVAPRRFLLTLLAAFASIAVALAVIGIYGVGAYAVSRQVREIGIRLALGARRRSIALLVLRTLAPWIAAGLMAGGLGAWALTRLLATYLYGVQPGDATTFAAVTIGLVAAAAAAHAVPVRRATRIDPATALRGE